ncbi:17894_t:CDS:2 [Funneliformis geosporum]|uniref:17569_t:CDS:1 n=1 Tax=Funneliformis geosporum TaxID=1117311 RepID=A0A9W4WML1_9GLOM|nr:17894_t:CDS:2 [Funneliformis geosporum]CAI2173183.1 17569_t:CDS:2 [Funneliformis geosporum]
MKFELYDKQLKQWPETGRHILGQYDDESIIVYQAYNNSIADYAIQHQKFGGKEFSWKRMTWIKTNFTWMMYRSGWATKKNQERILAIKLTRKGFEEILAEAALTSFSQHLSSNSQSNTPSTSRSNKSSKSRSNKSFKSRSDKSSKSRSDKSSKSRSDKSSKSRSDESSKSRSDTFSTLQHEWKEQLETSQVRLQWDPDHDLHGEKMQRRAIQLGIKNNILQKYSNEWIISIEDITEFVREQYELIKSNKLDEVRTPEEREYKIGDNLSKEKLGMNFVDSKPFQDESEPEPDFYKRIRNFINSICIKIKEALYRVTNFFREKILTWI